MFEKAGKFLKLTAGEKRLFLEAYVLLGVMRLAITTVPFKRLVRSLEHSAKPVLPPPLSPEQRRDAVAVSEAIAAAANNTPWESACLAQALTAQRMLRSRGVPGVFHLGVIRENEAKEKMKAHAWLLSGDLIVTGSGYEGFTILSSFSWEAA